MVFPASLASAAAEELAAILRDTRDNVASGNADWIANGQPESIVGKLSQANARQLCRRWARGSPSSYGRQSDANYEKLCGQYLDDIGEKPAEPKFSPQFTGGQCNTLYRVQISSQSRNPNLNCTPGQTLTQSFDVRDVPGPIRRVGWEFSGPQGSCGETPIGIRMVIQTDSGPVFAGSPGSNSRGYIASGTRVNSVTVTREDGLPDDCGDSPDRDIEPPPPITTPLPPISIEINPDFVVDIDVQVDVDGTINVTYQPDSTEPVTVPVSPPGEGGPKDAIPGQDEETGTAGDGSDGVAEGEAPEGQVLAGVKVDLVTAPPGANVDFRGGPLYRGACYCYLGLEGNLDLQPEGAIFRPGQFFFAPEGSTHWRVVAGLGYNLSVTPYYTPIAGKEPA